MSSDPIEPDGPMVPEPEPEPDTAPTRPLDRPSTSPSPGTVAVPAKYPEGFKQYKPHPWRRYRQPIAA